MKRNSILFAIALITAMAFAGNAAALAEPLYGTVNTTAAIGEVVMLWVQDDRTNNPGQNMSAIIGDIDLGLYSYEYYFSDIEPLLLAHGKNPGDPFNVTVAMLCDGYNESGVAYTNTYHNDAGVYNNSDLYETAGPTLMPQMNITPCPAAPYIDLNVSEISVNPSSYVSGVLFANKTNEICAKIVNDGTDDAGQFNVSFATTGIPGGYSKEVTVTGGIPAGENRTVCITDCQPIGPTAIDAVTINVTADCNLVVGESDEGNNSMAVSATVYNNGYMGKRLTGGEDINLVDTRFEGNIDLKYAVCNATTYVNATGEQDFGDNQTYLSGSSHPNWTEYRARWDNTPQLPIPTPGETIKSAKLYVYYTTSYYPDPDLNVSFNGMNYTMDDAVSRTDVKGWPSTSAYGNAPSGMLTYNVTSEFDSMANTMVVYNLKEPGLDKMTLQGAVLAVIYEHDDEPQRIIYVNEGFDLLTNAYYSCCTPAEATAYADFAIIENPSILANAALITISTGANDPSGHSMFFNGEEFEGGLDTGTYLTEGWSPPAQTSWMDITANETDVTVHQGSNTAEFQSYGDGFCMANTILVLTKAGSKSADTGSGIAYLSADKGDLEDFTAVAWTQDAGPDQNRPNCTFQYGLFSFNVTGLNATIGDKVNFTFELPEPAEKDATTIWKFNATTWYTIPATVTEGSKIVTFNITDNELGDENDTLGTIFDEFGVGTTVNVSIDPCSATIGSDPSARTTVDINLNGIADYGSGTIHLYFDTTYVDIDSIDLGDSTNFHSNKVTGGHYKISASNSDGISSDVAFANVTFKPMGPTTGCSYLNLVVETLYDRNFTTLSTVVNNCTICIEESNIPGVTAPTASPTRILNDNGRARVSGTNLSTLSVWVEDDTEVDTVTINLTPILGAGNDSVSMNLTSGTKQAGTWSVVTNATRDDGPSGLGINMTHCLFVNATDTHDNSNTANCVTLEVLRRGDIDPESVLIPRDNAVIIPDYNEIARYTVGLRSMPEEFTAGTVPADTHNGVDMADALYIAMYATYDPIPGYQAP